MALVYQAITQHQMQHMCQRSTGYTVELELAGMLTIMVMLLTQKMETTTPDLGTLLPRIMREITMLVIIRILIPREHSPIQEETTIIMVMFTLMLVTAITIVQQVHIQQLTLDLQACPIQQIHLDIREESIIMLDIILIRQAVLLIQRVVRVRLLIAGIRIPLAIMLDHTRIQLLL